MVQALLDPIFASANSEVLHQFAVAPEDGFEFQRTYFKERLGSGWSRHVYSVRGHDDYVVKWEDMRSGKFQNVTEWRLWQYARFMSRGVEWLAPCLAISLCGSFLLMRRTQPIEDAQRPDRVPPWMTDLKTRNFGLLDGRVVQHDYASNLLVNGLQTSRTRKAKWIEPLPPPVEPHSAKISGSFAVNLDTGSDLG